MSEHFGLDLYVGDPVQRNKEFREERLRKSITGADSAGKERYSKGTGIGPYGAYSREVGQSEFTKDEQFFLVLDPGIELDDLAYSHPEYATCIQTLKKTLGFFQTIKFQLYRLAVFMKTCVLSRSEEEHYKALTQGIRSLYGTNRRIVSQDQAEELVQRVRNVWVKEQREELQKIDWEYAKSFEQFLGKKPSVAPATQQSQQEEDFAFSAPSLSLLQQASRPRSASAPGAFSIPEEAPKIERIPSDEVSIEEEFSPVAEPILFAIFHSRRLSSVFDVEYHEPASSIPPAPPAPPLGVPVPPSVPSLTPSSKQKRQKSTSSYKNLRQKMDALVQQLQGLDREILIAEAANRRVSLTGEGVQVNIKALEAKKQALYPEVAALQKMLEIEKEEDEFLVVVKAPPEKKQPSSAAALGRRLTEGSQSGKLRESILDRIRKGNYTLRITGISPEKPSLPTTPEAEVELPEDWEDWPTN